MEIKTPLQVAADMAKDAKSKTGIEAVADCITIYHNIDNHWAWIGRFIAEDGYHRHADLVQNAYLCTSQFEYDLRGHFIDLLGTVDIRELTSDQQSALRRLPFIKPQLLDTLADQELGA